jgi:hypothetical protein
LAAAAVVVIGCQGGGSGGVATTGATATTGGDNTATANLTVPAGLINVFYITGQGRAAGSPTAVIRRVYFEDEFDVVEPLIMPERQLGLDAYSVQTVEISAPITQVNSRFFDTFTLEVSKIRKEQAGGGYVEYGGASNQPILIDQFDLHMRVFPSRTTSLAVFLNDAMLDIDENAVPQPALVWDRQLFIDTNFDPFEGKMLAFISDYVAFDISAMATGDRPVMSSGPFASKVYFSGDGQALSVSGSTGVFEVLIPSGHIDGTFNGPVPPANISSYTLTQIDPRDLLGVAKITSLQGTFRNYQEVLNNISRFEFITFPTSIDDEKQELVIIERNGGGAIIRMHFGEVDLLNGTFNAWPIANIDDASTDFEITGTVSGFVNRNGTPIGVASSDDADDVRAGTFTFDTPDPDLPASYATTGRFVVFRR